MQDDTAVINRRHWGRWWKRDAGSRVRGWIWIATPSSNMREGNWHRCHSRYTRYTLPAYWPMSGARMSYEAGFSLRAGHEAPYHLKHNAHVQPGSWEHLLMYIPWHFAIVARK